MLGWWKANIHLLLADQTFNWLRWKQGKGFNTHLHFLSTVWLHHSLSSLAYHKRSCWKSEPEEEKEKSKVSLLERRALSREVRREIAKPKVNYENNTEMQFGGSNIKAAGQGLKSIACINKQANEAKQHITIKGVLEAVTQRFQLLFLTFWKLCFYSEYLCIEVFSFTPDLFCYMQRSGYSFVEENQHMEGCWSRCCLWVHTEVLCQPAQWSFFYTLSDVCQSLSAPFNLEKLNNNSNTQNKNPEQLTEFRPVALTSLIMKIFEKIMSRRDCL